jgi:hypothetical protein
VALTERGWRALDLGTAVIDEYDGWLATAVGTDQVDALRAALERIIATPPRRARRRRADDRGHGVAAAADPLGLTRTSIAAAPAVLAHPGRQLGDAADRTGRRRDVQVADLRTTRGGQTALMAETSNSRVIFSLTSTPPVSRVAFQVTP